MHNSGPWHVTEWPEFNIVLFAVLLNLPWEFLQVPLYGGMPAAPHWQGVKTCVRASLGDAAIMVVAYWLVAWKPGRQWILQPTRRQLALFVAIGLGATLAIEKLALAGVWLDGWSYSDRMPLVPWIGVGLAPALQWIILPPLTVWFSKRQLAGAGGT